MNISGINNPDTRVQKVFALAVEVFGDEDAEAFMENGHRASLFDLDGDFIWPDTAVRDCGDKTKNIVNYLMERKNG